MVRNSGSADHPITFTAYGKGRAPDFSNADFNTLNGNVIQIQGGYIVIDGLYFHDGSKSDDER